MSDQSGCLLCGKPVVYHEKSERKRCSVCGREYETNSECSGGHYVCDECHAMPAYAVIRTVCSTSASKNPIEIASEIMNNPAVHMHGPEHHVIVGSALLAAYRNAGGVVDLDTGLDAVRLRGGAVPGGSCGFSGTCGAAVSAGIFLSVVLKTTPLSDDSWALGMKLTAECLNAIAENGGPRCCKRDTFSSVRTAAAFVDRNLQVSMDIPDTVVCTHSDRNRECIGARCPFHVSAASLRPRDGRNR